MTEPYDAEGDICILVYALVEVLAALEISEHQPADQIVAAAKALHKKLQIYEDALEEMARYSPSLCDQAPFDARAALREAGHPEYQEKKA